MLILVITFPGACSLVCSFHATFLRANLKRPRNFMQLRDRVFTLERMRMYGSCDHVSNSVYLTPSTIYDPTLEATVSLLSRTVSRLKWPFSNAFNTLARPAHWKWAWLTICSKCSRMMEDCDWIWENPAYLSNTHVVQCVFLASPVKNMKVQFLSYLCQRTFLLTVATAYRG